MVHCHIRLHRETPYGIRRASKQPNARRGPRQSKPARIHRCNAKRECIAVNAARLLRKRCMHAKEKGPMIAHRALPVAPACTGTRQLATDN
jgi:hypothetical protein